jgi:hypothetical protein
MTDAVHLRDLRQPRPAAGAPGEVGAQSGCVPGGEVTADVSAEAVTGPPALRVLGDRDMLLQVLPAQALTGAVGQDGDRVRREAEPRRDLRRAGALHLGVPQNVPPPGR